MFDYVRSEIPLPDGWTGELQSKDFDCVMTDIVIREDGRLEIERFEYESVPKKERPYPDAPEDTMKAVAGSVRRINRRWERLDHHGDFNFYGYDKIDGEYVWHEYIARFSNGRLDWIRAQEGREQEAGG